MVSSSRPRASSTTPAGLPPAGSEVKAAYRKTVVIQPSNHRPRPTSNSTNNSTLRGQIRDLLDVADEVWIALFEWIGRIVGINGLLRVREAAPWPQRDHVVVIGRSAGEQLHQEHLGPAVAQI